MASLSSHVFFLCRKGSLELEHGLTTVCHGFLEGGLECIMPHPFTRHLSPEAISASNSSQPSYALSWLAQLGPSEARRTGEGGSEVRVPAPRIRHPRHSSPAILCDGNRDKGNFCKRPSITGVCRTPVRSHGGCCGCWLLQGGIDGKLCALQSLVRHSVSLITGSQLLAAGSFVDLPTGGGDMVSPPQVEYGGGGQLHQRVSARGSLCTCSARGAYFAQSTGVCAWGKKMLRDCVWRSVRGIYRASFPKGEVDSLSLIHI